MTGAPRRGERNPKPFTIRRYGSSVDFVLPDRSRATLRTGWPKMPDLSVLCRVVASGVELDNALKRHKL